MTRKKNTIQSLEAELATLEATIEKFTRARGALIEVITYLGEDEQRGAPSYDRSSSTNAEAEEATGSNDGATELEALPPLPREGFAAIRNALAVREQS